jgi:hypothetical protein
MIMIRAITLTILLSAAFLSVNGQDVLVKRNGKTIEGKVTEVGIDKVLYKISKDPDGANFVIRKNELNRIEFGNGQTVFINDRFQDSNKKRRDRDPDENFGRNFINFSPFKALDSGPGFGISYEAIVDKRGYFGVILPVSMIFPDSYFYSYDGQRNNSQMYYFSPGLKIYPFGQKKVTYAVGPTVFMGWGNRRSTYTNYEPTTGVYTDEDDNAKRFRLGMLVNNYVNFQITQHFQISLNAGLGSRYIDRETSKFRNYSTSGMQIMGEFNFSLGLRF